MAIHLDDDTNDAEDDAYEGSTRRRPVLQCAVTEGQETAIDDQIQKVGVETQW